MDKTPAAGSIGSMNSVTVKGDTVYVVLSGPQPKEVSWAMLERFKLALNQVRLSHDKVFVMVDLRGLTIKDVTVDSRLAIKEAFGLPFYRLAALGKNHLLEVSVYLMRAGGASKKARYFTSENRATQWLRDAEKPSERLGNGMAVGASIVGYIGWSSLLGWWLNNAYLMRWVPDLRPINPMAAVGLILVSAALCLLWIRRWRWAMIPSSLVLLLGVLALLPLDIDFWIFGEKVREVGDHIWLADSAAICFIMTGVSLWLFGFKGRLAHWCTTVLAFITGLVGLFNMFGLLYGRQAVYDISQSFVMALNLSVAFVMVSGLLLYLAVRRRLSNASGQIGLLGWSVVSVLLILQVATYVAWRQSIDRNEQDTTNSFQAREAEIGRQFNNRFQAYIDTLHGFRGLYEASSTVNQKEFETYNKSVDVTRNYPGVRALYFINRVEDRNVPAYIAERRADNSMSPGANKDFTVKNRSNLPVHYFVSYLANFPTTTANGTDLSGDAVRRETFQKAEQTGETAASKSVVLLSSAAGSAPRKGFFITIPVKKQNAKASDGANQYVGFVSAAFSFDEFFAALLKDSPLPDGLLLQVKDRQDGTIIFRQDKNRNDAAWTSVQNIQVADRTWQVQMEAGPSFGLSEAQANVPKGVLFAGQVISLMLVLIFVMLYRSRGRAMELADHITADLQTERNRAVALRQKDEAILSSIGDAVFAIDNERRITLFNHAAERITGYSADEAIGQLYSDVLHFAYEQNNTINSDFIDRARQGELAAMEGRTYLVHKDGNQVPVADSAAPIRDADDNIIGVIVVFRDASNDRALSAERNQLQTILNSLPVGVYVAEVPDGVPVLVNAKAEELIGSKFDEQTSGDKYSEPYRVTKSDGITPYPEAEMPIAITIATGKPAVKDDLTIKRKDGSLMALRATSAPILDDDGTMRRAVVVSEDMTKERELDKAKTEFVSLASHQLRTPLSAINWYAEILLDQTSGALNKEQREYAKEIYEGNQRMVELVNALLDVSRLDLGKLTNDPKPTSLVEVSESILKELQVAVLEKGITLKRDLDNSLRRVEADPKLLRMMVQNLLSNAVKYTPAKGKVTLSVGVASIERLKEAGLPADGKEEYALFSVADTGYGIPAAQQNKIFGKMFRADNVQALDVEGTGLGLYIVKQVAEKLGGRVWFTSKEGVGTTFYVILPVKSHATIKDKDKE